VNRIFLEGVKGASFPFVRSFRESNRNSEVSGKKSLMILEFGGHGG